MTNFKWKLIGILTLIIGSVYLLVPSVFDFRSRIEDSEASGQSVPAFVKFFPNRTLNLGLDLRGGIYLEMDVDLETALENRLDTLLLSLERGVEPEEFPDLKLVRQAKQVEVWLQPENKSNFLALLNDGYDGIFVVQESSSRPDGPLLVLDLTAEYQNDIKRRVLEQAEQAVRNRIDRYGVVEASIQTQGSDRLIVEIPGVKDPDRVIDMVRKTGLLEFKLVDASLSEDQLLALVSEARSQDNLGEGYDAETVKKINAALVAKLPDTAAIYFSVQRDPITKKIVNGTPYLLTKRTQVTGDMLQNAQVNIQNNEPYVNLSFNNAGTKSFGDVTRNNVNKRLAIVLDGTVSSTPVIQEPILTGEARITLGFGGSYEAMLKEAEDLALVLREGALPTALTMATKTIIGPSLGLDSIKKGLHSLLIAALVIMAFMMVYYKAGGLLSTVALVLNVLFIFSILSLLGASLTLPGMAGIVLTLGMAVDANIIIFERMREEQRLNKTAKTIIESGYSNAMSAILDANVTTLIAGIVLFQFGTGPIKGFATTLIIGIATTLFTAVYLTRFVFDYFIYKVRIKKVMI